MSDVTIVHFRDDVRMTRVEDIIDHIEKNVRNSDMEDFPFKHMYIQDFFPLEFTEQTHVENWKWKHWNLTTSSSRTTESNANIGVIKKA